MMRHRSDFLFGCFQLTEVNDAMSESTSTSLGQSNATQLHTLQRHRDILQDYSHEFSKTKVKKEEVIVPPRYVDYCCAVNTNINSLTASVAPASGWD